MTDMADAMLRSASRSFEQGLTDPFEYRRSVSASYYAVYHAMAKAFADALVGATDPRPRRAWLEVYRGIDHKACAEACRTAVDAKVSFPEDLLSVAADFRQLQTARHKADYDPDADFGEDEADRLLAMAKLCVDQINNTSVQDMKAFAVWSLIKGPGTKAVRATTHPKPTVSSTAPSKASAQTKKTVTKKPTQSRYTKG